ncbi:MAG: hypothetical protein GY714_27030 [Desulfobacterales bacterium]|nr:hypothetical protein [Desulfobacterales bacterium]
MICGKKTYVLKTSKKTCYSFSLGQFTLIAGYTFCKDHKYIPVDSNNILKYHSQLAMEIVEKNYQITFDLLVKVGELRYQDHRQLEEIKTFLKCSMAKTDLPLSTIGMISKRYLECCKRLHEKYEGQIIEDIRANGGYVLHFDGSTEQKCGKTTFVVKDSKSGHVLISEMIDSENHKDVKPLLEIVRKKYGIPLVILSDLRSWFVSVCQEVFGEKVLHILCHYHFLRTFKSFFCKEHKLIQTHLTHIVKLRAEIQYQLELVKTETAVKPVNINSKSFEEIKMYWMTSGDALITYQHLLSWILKFKQDSSGKGLPFDLPYLDFYNRFMRGKKLIDVVFSDKKRTNSSTRLKFYYNGFLTIVKKMDVDKTKNKEFRAHIRQLEYLRKWFMKLRGTLFMEAAQENRDTLAPLSKRYRLTQEEAKAIPKNIQQYLEELKKEFTFCKNKKKKEILMRFQKQTKKHHKNLTVPILTVNIDEKTETFIPYRTNNFLETSFRSDKTIIRRQTGRSKLPREFGSVGALLPYFKSMKKHRSFRHFFDNATKLAEEFANVTENDLSIP